MINKLTMNISILKYESEVSNHPDDSREFTIGNVERFEWCNEPQELRLTFESGNKDVIRNVKYFSVDESIDNI